MSGLVDIFINEYLYLYRSKSTKRALVLQGGRRPCSLSSRRTESINRKLGKKEIADKDGPLFDIVAGTSMGAMNAAVLVGNVINRNKTWEEAAVKLENFWTDDNNGLSSKVEFSKWWWNDENSQNKVSASEEALRKYYSVKEYVTHGTPRVCPAPYIGSISPKYDDLFDRLNRILDRFGRDIESLR